MPSVEAPFAQVPVSLLRDHSTTCADYRVYICLDNWAGKRGVWFCAQAEIAEETGLSPRSVRAATKRLEQRGHITMHRLGSDHATRIEYTIVARVRALLASERKLGSARPRPSTGRTDPQRSEVECRSDRKRTSSPYKEPQIPPQIPTTDRTPLTPRERGAGPPSLQQIRASRAEQGSRRQRDIQAADEVCGPNSRYFRGPYGRILQERALQERADEGPT